MIDPHSLQTHSLFGGLTDDQMEVIIPYLKEERFDAAFNIVTEGDDGERIYFIQEGSVEILKSHLNDDGTDEQRKLAELHVGDAFGEMELIDIQSRAATVRSLGPIAALSLSNADLYKIYHKDMKIFTILIMNLARDISRRLRKMDNLLADIMHENQQSANEKESAE